MLDVDQGELTASEVVTSNLGGRRRFGRLGTAEVSRDGTRGKLRSVS